MKEFGIASNSTELRTQALRELRPLPEGETKHLTLDDVKAGGFVKVQDTVYKVLEINLYVEDEEWEWKEMRLLSLKDGGITYLEWEDDDGIEYCLTTGKPRLRDLKDRSGETLREGSVAQTLKAKGNLTHNGVKYYFEEKCKVKFFRNEDSKGEKAKIFDYESDDGLLLTVERWEDDDGEAEHEAFTSIDVDPGDINVVMIGG